MEKLPKPETVDINTQLLADFIMGKAEKSMHQCKKDIEDAVAILMGRKENLQPGDREIALDVVESYAEYFRGLAEKLEHWVNAQRTGK